MAQIYYSVGVVGDASFKVRGCGALKSTKEGVCKSFGFNWLTPTSKT